jgi:hypothetical protein
VSCIVAPPPLLERNSSLYSDSDPALVAVMYRNSVSYLGETDRLADGSTCAPIIQMNEHIRGTLYIVDVSQNIGS